MLEIPSVVLVVSEIGEGAESLHESLGRAIVEDGFDGLFLANLFPKIEKLSTIVGRVVHVGVVNQGGEIVFLSTHTQALKIDQEGGVVVEHEVLRLEIAMHHMRCRGPKTFGQGKEDGVVRQFGGILAEVCFDKVLEKVFLFPAIEWLVKGGLEFEVLGRSGVEQLVELFEGGAVVGFAFFEGGVFETEEILIAQIFNESDLASGVVVKDLGDVKSGFLQEFCNRQEVGVVGAFEGVVDADEAGVIVGSDSDDGSTGSTLLDRLHEDAVGGREIQVGADGGEQSIGRHLS